MTIEEQAEIDITPLIVVTLHLGTILTLEMPEEGTEDHMKLHRAMYELVRLDIRTKNVRCAIDFSAISNFVFQIVL